MYENTLPSKQPFTFEEVLVHLTAVLLRYEHVDCWGSTPRRLKANSTPGKAAARK